MAVVTGCTSRAQDWEPLTNIANPLSLGRVRPPPFSASCGVDPLWWRVYGLGFMQRPGMTFRSRSVTGNPGLDDDGVGYPHRNGQVQRPRPSGMTRRCAPPHPRTSQQPNRRVAAVELQTRQSPFRSRLNLQGRLRRTLTADVERCQNESRRGSQPGGSPALEAAARRGNQHRGTRNHHHSRRYRRAISYTP